MFNQEEEMEQGVKTTVLSLKDLKMEVIINNRFKEFSFDSNVRGFYVYKNIWNPRIGKDCLKCRHEKRNEHDDFMIDVYRNKRFIRLSQSKLCSKVTGKQVKRQMQALGLKGPLNIHFTYTKMLHSGLRKK